MKNLNNFNQIPHPFQPIFRKWLMDYLNKIIIKINQPDSKKENLYNGEQY